MFSRTFVPALLVVICSLELSWGEGKWTNYTSGNDVKSLASEGGYIWAGTTGGVVRWDINTKTYVKYTTKNGLSNNHINTIIADDDGNIWAGTNNGIKCTPLFGQNQSSFKV